MLSGILRCLVGSSLMICVLGTCCIVCFGQQSDEPRESSSAVDAAASSDESQANRPLPTASKDGTPAASAGDFDKLYAEWKTKLDQLVQLRDQYLAAADDAKAELRQQMSDVVAAGEKLLPPLAASAEAAFLADSKADSEAAQFLLEVMRDRMRKDSYEEAHRLAELMVEHGAKQEELASQAGVAAFMVNEFDLADKYFSAAEQANAFGGQARGMQAHLGYYRELWKEESALRKTEGEANDLPRVKLKTTKGDIVIELFENEAPQTVGNFVSLVEEKFYDGLTFHRVLPNFMAQGGCPEGTGTGGPGYQIPCECVNDKHRKHFRGVISMAHSGRDTGGSQFYLTFVPTKHLDGQHTVFGRIISGMDVLGKLKRREPGAREPVEPDKIVEATVLRKRDHEYKPTKVAP